MNTSRTPIQVYALTVCFAALLCFVITFGIAVYDVVQIAAPEFTYSPDAYSLEPAPGTIEYQEAIQDEKHGAARSLVQTSIILLIDIAVFTFHWKVANRSITQMPSTLLTETK